MLDAFLGLYSNFNKSNMDFLVGRQFVVGGPRPTISLGPSWRLLVVEVPGEAYLCNLAPVRKINQLIYQLLRY